MTAPIVRDVLPNGLRLLTERMPHVRSVSIGVWVRSNPSGVIEASPSRTALQSEPGRSVALSSGPPIQ